MIKQLKILPILAITGILAACGAADSTSDKTTITPDDAAPVILSMSPDLINKGEEILVSTKEFVFSFDEPLDKNSINNLENVNFISLKTGKVLKGTWLYKENAGVYTLTFTFDFSSLGDGVTALPSNEKFQLNFNNTIKDLAGNSFTYTVTFNTPLTYDIEVTTAGLASSASVDLKIEDQGSAQSSSTQTIDTNGVTTIEARFKSNTQYKITITRQPDADIFCALSNASGTIAERNAKVSLDCSNVVPYVSYAKNWNDYYYQLDANGTILQKPLIHGGEQRKFVMDNLQNCDNLTIADDLNAFDWSCEVDNTDPAAPKTIIFSTNLKSGKYLSDLINFSRTSPSWKKNAVSVKQDGSTELNQNKVSAIWWNNAVEVPSSAKLTSYGTVYIIPDSEADLVRSYSIDERHISFVVKPGVTLTAQPNSETAILVNRTGVWLEGEINANASTVGLEINNGYYTQIHNLKIYNALGNGIQLNDSELSYLSAVTAMQNSGNGIAISGNSASLDGNTYGNILRDVVVTFNSQNGILVNSQYNRLSTITASSNEMNGISVSKNNYISDSNSFNNTNSGLVLNGHNNIVTRFTTSSNGNAGIQFTNSSQLAPKSNLLSSFTTANNAVAGIIFDSNIADFPGVTGTEEERTAIIDSNLFLNALDAYNGGASDCGASTVCDNNTVITQSDIAMNELFVHVTADSVYPDYTDTLANIAVGSISNYIPLQNNYRAWGSLDGAGNCYTDYTTSPSTVVFCSIYDWSLNINNAALARNINAQPAALLSHAIVSSDNTQLSFLENAVEPFNDDSGNDNGICESGEKCLFTPNIGSYQGHDSTQAISDPFWENEGIMLDEFLVNGR